MNAAARTSLQSIDCIAFGVPMHISAGTPALFAELPSLLPYGTVVTAEANASAKIFSLLPSDTAGHFLCLEDTDTLLASNDLRSVCEALRQALMIHVANYAEERVFVHAGVVAYGGKALVLPGTSFAGKSTLTAALVRAGATYYSDEYAVLDDEGFVHPYARDLSIRQPGDSRQHSVAVSAFGGVVGTGRVRVALVLFTQYLQDAQWSPQSVSKGMAALEMLKHAIPVQRTPARVMAALARMLEGATAWRSSRGDADQLAAILLAWLAHGSDSDRI